MLSTKQAKESVQRRNDGGGNVFQTCLATTMRQLSVAQHGRSYERVGLIQHG